ncbi:MAG: plasmid replication, integration and excision activator [Pseudonocardiaceae bacterium]|nr:plasmid replication, integration and excision activator [Pseudonocardiaceae bacterium]
MAINGKFRVSMEDVFPHGAFVVSEVDPVRDFDKSTPQKFVQQNDKETGLPMWAVSVLDADPDARKADKTVTVKVLDTVQPVPPETTGGTPFRPVEFDGLTVTPYLDDKRGRVAYSLRARAMRAPAKTVKPAGSADGKAVA